MNDARSDHLPEFIKPMLARSSEPFDSDDHIFELKWDGTRCIAFIDRKGIRLQNRRLLDITYRYPEFHDLHTKIRADSAIIDGEIVVLREGVPDFRKLQEREHVEEEMRIGILSGLIPATYVVFDLLYLNERSLMERPLMERRNLLKEIIPAAEVIVFSESFEREGKKLFQMAVEKGFEGIMAKHKESPYLPGVRSEYWLKIKKIFDIDAIVCGYLKGEGGRSELFGSLVLGVYKDGRLIHIGQVGTGFDYNEARLIYNKLQPIDKNPFDTLPEFKRPVVWCKPTLVVRVKFNEWTHDGKLRAPVFIGIRSDKKPEECTI